MSAAMLIRAAAWLALFVTSLSLARADTWTGLRTSLACCGDIDHDGVPDFVVANRDLLSSGVVWLLSGRDGSVLHVFRGSVEGDGFGEYVGAIGDLDGDGLPEIVVSSRGWHYVDASTTPSEQSARLTRAGERECQVFSSQTFERLQRWPQAGSVSSIKDRDGDSVPDLVVVLSNITDYRSDPSASAPRIVSGIGGNTILEVPALSDATFLSGSAAVLGDIDGDGFDDFAVGISRKGSKDNAATGAVAISGKEGRVLWRHEKALHDTAAIILVTLGDIDHDGHRDLLVAQQDRWVHAVSGKSGALIYSVGTNNSGDIDAFAASLDVIHDVDGDGIAGWIVGANEQVGKSAFDEGYAWLCSSQSGKRLKTLFDSRQEGVDVCSLGDADQDGIPDVVLHIQDAGHVYSPHCNPLIRVVSTKDGHTIWEKDTKTLRKALEAPAATAAPENPR